MKTQKYYDDLDRRIELILAQTIEDRKRAEEDRKKAEDFFKQSVEDRKKAEKVSSDLDKLIKRQENEYNMVKESVGLRWKYAEEVASRGMRELFGRQGIELHEIRRNVKGKLTKREFSRI